MAYAPHPLARRIHDGVMQLLGTALVKTEMCEQLARLGRQDEIPANLVELRSALEDTVVELRLLMVEMRNLPTTGTESLKNRAA
jgi:signal transduction histidine kinase